MRQARKIKNQKKDSIEHEFKFEIDENRLDEKSYVITSIDGFPFKFSLSEISRISKKLLDDEEVAHALYKTRTPYLSYLSERLQHNKEIIFEALRANKENVHLVEKSFLSDKNFIKEALQNNIYVVLEACDEALKNDKEIISAFLKSKPDLRDVSEKLRDNKRVVLNASASFHFYLGHVSERLRNDKRFMMRVIANKKSRWQHLSVEYLGEELKKDRDIVKALLMYRRQTFRELDPSFRDDKELALLAVKNNFRNFEYLSDRLRNDREIAVTLIMYSSSSINMLSEKFRDDREIALMAAQVPIDLDRERGYRRDDIPFSYVSSRLRDDEEIALEAVKHTPYALSYVSERLRADKVFMLRVIDVTATEYYGPSFELAGDNLKGDKEFMLHVIKVRSDLFFMAKESLRKDKDFVLQVLQHADSIPKKYMRVVSRDAREDIFYSLDKKTRESIQNEFDITKDE